MKRNIVIGSAFAALTACLGGVQANPLHYGWKTGQDYVYNVRVEADYGEFIDTLAGTYTYSVRSSTPAGFTLAARGQLTPHRLSATGKPIGRDGRTGLARLGLQGVLNTQENSASELRMEVLRADGAGHLLGGARLLPQALGDLARIIVEPLPADGKTDWKVTRNVNIVLNEVSSVNRSASTRGTRAASPQVVLAAKEQISYHLAPASARRVTVNKIYELATVTTLAGSPRLQLNGQGKLQFDSRLGIPQSLQFQATLLDNTGPRAVSLPLTISYTLVDSVNPATASAAGSGDVMDLDHGVPNAGWALKNMPDYERQPLSPTALDQVLSNLHSDDAVRRTAACDALYKAEPNDRRATIARTLEPMLTVDDLWTRIGAARALGVWGTAESVPVLITALDDPEFSVRWSAIDALGMLRDPSAAPALVRHLEPFQDRRAASKALQAIGSQAAPAVLAFLRHRDWQVRMEVCRILKAIGTREILPALQPLTHDSSGIVVLAANDASHEIASRSGAR